MSGVWGWCGWVFTGALCLPEGAVCPSRSRASLCAVPCDMLNVLTRLSAWLDPASDSVPEPVATPSEGLQAGKRRVLVPQSFRAMILVLECILVGLRPSMNVVRPSSGPARAVFLGALCKREYARAGAVTLNLNLNVL